MTGSAKRKGDKAEREIAGLLAGELGYSVRRKLGAGRQDDTGDLDGIPGTTVQIADWTDLARAFREKPVAAEQQRVNAGDLFAVTFLRTRGGVWRAVMTVPQFAVYCRESAQ